MPGPLSLKQRLQALSTNIANGAQGSSSGDSFSLNSPKSPGPRIRAFLSQNIMRRPQESFNGNANGNGNGHGNEQGYSESQDRVQEVMSRLIFQAGVDYE
jgi:Rho GTPase-activating protein 1